MRIQVALFDNPFSPDKDMDPVVALYDREGKIHGIWINEAAVYVAEFLRAGGRSEHDALIFNNQEAEEWFNQVKIARESADPDLIALLDQRANEFFDTHKL